MPIEIPGQIKICTQPVIGVSQILGNRQNSASVRVMPISFYAAKENAKKVAQESLAGGGDPNSP
jgi:hypothetical protein